MATTTTKPSYFIAKVANIPALAKCINTGVWACKDRITSLTSPQPRELLTKAFTSGQPVIIVFSVNNCHGYQGYAEMLTTPATKAENETDIVSGITDSREISSKRTERQIITNSQEKERGDRGHENNNETETDTKTQDAIGNGQLETWHYFNVKWKLSFLKEFGEQCLTFSETNDLYLCMDNDESLPLNKCRNWQEMAEMVGQKLCERLENRFSELCTKRDAKLQKQLDKQADVFYQTGQEETTEQTWQRIIAQVEKDLGTTSVRRRVTDMFLVYQAKTEQVLGFNAPKQTVKNSEREVCDYTIHEVHRYCELLASGDARCVETLFLHDATVIRGSLEWQKLVQGRQLLLNKDCMNKYLRDAQGSKGTRYLRKWCDDNKQALVLPPKLCKMLYVIVRLLQNARDVAIRRDIKVYRESGSKEREQLMSIRAGGITVATAWEIIQGLEFEISAKESNVPDKTEEATKFLERWLLDMRYEDFVESRKMEADSGNGTS